MSAASGTRPSLAEAVEGARAALGGPGEVFGVCDTDRPRFELFHGAASICSQKVRAVLAHHGLPYVAEGVDMFSGQTYRPATSGCA